MEKVIIHTVDVTAGKQKILFQILLPEDAEAITGIAVTCDRYEIYAGGSPKKENRVAGILHLFMSDTGDKLFSQTLHGVALPPYWQTIGDKNLVLGLWDWKKQFEMLDTYQPTENLLIDGFYEDGVGTIVLDGVEYKVRIYLRLKMKSK